MSRLSPALSSVRLAALAGLLAIIAGCGGPWAAPQAGRSVHVLAPLGVQEAQELAQALGANGQTAQIVETAEGNPLFLEQLVAVGAEGEALPPTIHAVLAARIDLLPRTGRIPGVTHGSSRRPGLVRGVFSWLSAEPVTPARPRR